MQMCFLLSLIKVLILRNHDNLLHRIFHILLDKRTGNFPCNLPYNFPCMCYSIHPYMYCSKHHNTHRYKSFHSHQNRLFHILCILPYIPQYKHCIQSF